MCSSTTTTKPGVAALVGALRAPLGVGRGEEEHVHPLDERAVLGADRGVHLDLLEAVREPPRVEAVLQLARPVVVEVAHAVEYLPLIATAEQA